MSRSPDPLSLGLLLPPLLPFSLGFSFHNGAASLFYAHASRLSGSSSFSFMLFFPVQLHDHTHVFIFVVFHLRRQHVHLMTSPHSIPAVSLFLLFCTKFFLCEKFSVRCQAISRKLPEGALYCESVSSNKDCLSCHCLHRIVEVARSSWTFMAMLSPMVLE